MVMVWGFTEIQIKISLLEIGVQLMTLPVTSFQMMNVTPC